MKTSELTGAALDWAVAQCEGFKRDYWDDDRLCFTDDWGADFEPSCDWLQGGKIIERELIDILTVGCGTDGWQANKYLPDEMVTAYGETPLIAAMRCYVAMKLGDEVRTPEELLDSAHG